MKKLVEIVKLVYKKYIEDFNFIIMKDCLILEYLKYINNEKDVYKTFEIRERKDKLEITFIPEEIKRIVNLEELEELIAVLQKQSKVKNFTEEELMKIKQEYSKGTNIELIKMYDYINPVPAGTKGIIDFVDNIGTVHVNWENGSSLGLVIGIDEFKII